MSNVDHPPHYGGEDNLYEVIKVAEAWGFDEDAYLFNVLKYIGRPDKGLYLEDLKKARFYLDRKITRLEASIPAGTITGDKIASGPLTGYKNTRYVAVYTEPDHNPFSQCGAYVNTDWTVETLASLIATMTTKPEGTYTIGVGPRAGNTARIDKNTTVAWLLKHFAPHVYNYYLEKV